MKIYVGLLLSLSVAATLSAETTPRASLPNAVMQMIKPSAGQCFTRAKKRIGPTSPLYWEEDQLTPDTSNMPMVKPPPTADIPNVYDGEAWPDADKEIFILHVQEKYKTEWRPIVCEAGVSDALIGWVNDRLFKGPRKSLKLDSNFYAALNAFQHKNDLFVDGLTYETLRALAAQTQ